MLSRRHATFATTASQLLLIYTLQRLLPAWPGVPEPPAEGLFSLRVAVLRTGVLGVCFIATLAGFGTVAFPYSVLRAFVVPVNPQEIKALQTQLQLIREQVWPPHGEAQGAISAPGPLLLPRTALQVRCASVLVWERWVVGVDVLAAIVRLVPHKRMWHQQAAAADLCANDDLSYTGLQQCDMG